MKSLTLGAVLLGLVLGGAAQAEDTRELYAVGVYEGSNVNEVRGHGTSARIVVDRPGVTVSLALGSYEPVQWSLEVTEGTRIEQVLVHGYESDESVVLLNGEAYAGHETDQSLRSSFRAQGINGRKIVAQVPQRLGFDALSGFMGAYEAPDAGFVIRGEPPEDPLLNVDYLADLTRRDLVPAALRDALDTDAALSVPEIVFNYDGFVLSHPSGKPQKFAAPKPSADLPEISWPAGAAYDPVGGRLFGVTLGGEGHLYQVDRASGHWSVLSGMENFDASGMLYDARGKRLILGGHRHRVVLAIYDFARGLSWPAVESAAFPGLTDLYDPDNGPAPGLHPVAVLGDLLLARAYMQDHSRPPGTGASGPSRTYLVDLATGAVTLAAYSD